MGEVTNCFAGKWGVMVKTGGRGMDDLPKCGGGNLVGSDKLFCGKMGV